MAADEQRQLKVTDMVTMSSPGKGSPPGQKIWHDAYDVQTPVDMARVHSSAKARLDTAAAKQCVPPNDSYLTFVNRALAEAYDPTKFGNDPEVVRHEFDCQIHSEADARKYAEIVLKRSGDSHTHVLSPGENLALKNKSDPKTVGFGMKTDFDASFSTPGHEHGVVVARAYDHTPAKEAGLQPGDEILSVDSQDLTKLPYAAANAKLHGTAGSIARLVVKRDDQPFNVDIERKSVDLPDVTDVSLPNKLAYISIDDFFNEHLAEQLGTALKKHDDARGFIIDLRHNGGGNVDLMTDALSETMNNGDIMKSRERNLKDTDHISYTTRSYKLTAKGIQTTETSDASVPMTLQVGDTNDSVKFPIFAPPKVKTRVNNLTNLVGNRPVEIITDEQTASAAEMFTGAEHDTAHARVAGTYTYGKGIEGLYANSMPDSAGEVISNAHWWTPAGHWAGDAEQQRHGLKPDIEVHNPFGAIPLTGNDKQLAAAIGDLEMTLSKKAH